MVSDEVWHWSGHLGLTPWWVFLDIMTIMTPRPGRSPPRPNEGLVWHVLDASWKKKKKIKKDANGLTQIEVDMAAKSSILLLD